MINQRTPPEEVARIIAVDFSSGPDRTAHFTCNVEEIIVESSPPIEIKSPYSKRLSPMQQTLAMATGTTPQEITKASLRVPVKARRADPKAKAKRKQAKASRARNRK